MKHSSEELKKDRGVVLAAVGQDGTALEYASKELNNSDRDDDDNGKDNNGNNDNRNERRRITTRTAMTAKTTKPRITTIKKPKR